jgi:hypothetical protein
MAVLYDLLTAAPAPVPEHLAHSVRVA